MTTTISACKGLPTCSKCGDILPMFDKHECNPAPTNPPTETVSDPTYLFHPDNHLLDKKPTESDKDMEWTTNPPTEPREIVRRKIIERKICEMCNGHQRLLIGCNGERVCHICGGTGVFITKQIIEESNENQS